MTVNFVDAIRGDGVGTLRVQYDDDGIVSLSWHADDEVVDVTSLDEITAEVDWDAPRCEVCGEALTVQVDESVGPGDAPPVAIGMLCVNAACSEFMRSVH
jgi:hypothetical protein